MREAGPQHSRGFGGGWFKSPRAVVHRILPRYGPGCAAVLMILLEARDQHSLVAKDTSQEEIARLMGGITVRHVYNLTKPLRADGLVKGIRRGRGLMWYALSPEFKQILEKIGDEEQPVSDVKRRIGGPLYDHPVEMSNRNYSSTRSENVSQPNNGTSTSNRKSGSGRREAPSGTTVPVEAQVEPQFQSKSPNRKSISAPSGTTVPVGEPYKVFRKETKYETEKSSSSSLLESSPAQHSQDRVSSHYSQHIDRSEVLEYMQGWTPTGVVDNKALELQILACLERDPQATTGEIVYFIAKKGEQMYERIPTDMGHRLQIRPDIRSPIGFLRTAVAECFEGGANSAAAHYRRAQMERKAAQV